MGQLPIRAALETVPAYFAPMSTAEAEHRTGRSDLATLANNENLYGPSPAVAAALGESLAQLHAYPDPDTGALRARLATDLGVEPARLIFGPGSEALIDYALRIALDPGDALVQSPPTFPPYAAIARTQGADVVNVPRLASMALDLEALGRALAAKPRVFVLCTPNNPTGNHVTADELAQILAVTPHDTLVILDEAYREYVQPLASYDSLKLLDRWGGAWLSLRTFSKAYGLASVRVGYGIASSASLVEYLNRVRPLFNLPHLSQVAALAAWNDAAHLEAVVTATQLERSAMDGALRRLGFDPTPSEGNFCFFAVPDAQHLAASLLAEGIMVRAAGPAHLRITIGRAEDNARLLAALRALI